MYDTYVGDQVCVGNYSLKVCLAETLESGVSLSASPIDTEKDSAAL